MARSRGRPQYTEVAIATRPENRPGSEPRSTVNTTGPPIEWATSTGRTKPECSMARLTASAASSKVNGWSSLDRP